MTTVPNKTQVHHIYSRCKKPDCSRVATGHCSACDAYVRDFNQDMCGRHHGLVAFAKSTFFARWEDGYHFIEGMDSHQGGLRFYLREGITPDILQDMRDTCMANYGLEFSFELGATNYATVILPNPKHRCAQPDCSNPVAIADQTCANCLATEQALFAPGPVQGAGTPSGRTGLAIGSFAIEFSGTYPPEKGTAWSYFDHEMHKDINAEQFQRMVNRMWSQYKPGMSVRLDEVSGRGRPTEFYYVAERDVGKGHMVEYARYSPTKKVGRIAIPLFSILDAGV